MKKLKHPIPGWVTQGKTVKQLVKELESIEDQDMEVRLSLDDGDTHSCISLVTQSEGQYCLLVNSESYHEHAWQVFMDEQENNTD